MLADDLRRAAICQWNGILYAAGWADGGIWFEYSDRSDLGKSEIPGAGLRVKICDADEQQPAIEVLPTSEIVVAVDIGDTVATYYSPDQGITWLAASSAP